MLKRDLSRRCMGVFKYVNACHCSLVFMIINNRNSFKLAQVKQDQYRASKETPRDIQEMEP